MMYKEVKKYTIQESYPCSGETDLDSRLETYLKDGWEIITTYTTRDMQSRSEYSKTGTSFQVNEDGYFYVNFILGRREMPGVLYG